MSLALRVGEAIGELVDDQPILIGQRRRHALALDPRHLEAERDDERGVDGGGGQRLDPRDELVAPELEPAQITDERSSISSANRGRLLRWERRDRTRSERRPVEARLAGVECRHWTCERRRSGGFEPRERRLIYSFR